MVTSSANSSSIKLVYPDGTDFDAMLDVTGSEVASGLNTRGLSYGQPANPKYSGVLGGSKKKKLTDKYEKYNKSDLMKMAKLRNIKGRSTMTRNELVKKLAT